jgi:DNA-binding NtrC family response regulator
MLEASRPGVVLLDIRLDTPDRGWEILRQLRRTDWGRSLPVVLCSAGAALTDWPDDLDRDGIEEVSKPFELDDLVTVLARCLERAPSRTSKLGARR